MRGSFPHRRWPWPLHRRPGWNWSRGLAGVGGSGGSRPAAILGVAAGLCALSPSAAGAAAWGAPEKVSLPAQTAGPSELFLSANPSGRAVAVWKDAAGTVVAAALLPAGSLDFGAPSVISDGSGAVGPKVSVGNGGVAVATWQTTAGDDLIKAARLDAGDTLFGAPAVALDSATPGESVTEPAVAVTPSGEATIVADGPFTFPPFSHEWATAQAAGGGAWSAVDDFQGNNENQFSKLAAGDHESVIWLGKHDTCCNQRAYSTGGMTAASNDWVGGAGIALGDGNGTGCLCGFGHDLARLANGDAIVLISRNSGGTGQDLSYGSYDLARAQGGSTVIPETPLTTAPANRAGGDRRIVSNSAGTTAAVWAGIAGEIWAATRPDAGSFGAPQQLLASGADPALDAAIAGNGDVHVVYTGADKVWGITRLAGGGVTAPDQLSGTESGVSSPKVVAFANGGAEAIWEGNDPDEGGASKVFAAGLDATVQPPGGEPSERPTKNDKKCRKGKRKKAKRGAGAAKKKKGCKKRKKK